ncbi:MAG: oxidoreductase [Sedimenticolaceae bacterium]|jgi:ferredoxin--NADP+ reductase
MTEMTQELGPVSEAVVTESVRITPQERDEVRRIKLRIDDPAFRFSVGQSIGVVVPGPHPMGNQFHTRRYSIASGHRHSSGDEIELELLVRRCFYIDDISGEKYPGIASNFLCDAEAGGRITITGPYRSPFKIPDDDRANLLMIGTGTGVAPFRAFIQEVYAKREAWRGQVRLYYGARSGMDLLYRNDEEDDLSNYYDQASFKAFRALITKPMATDAQTLEAALKEHASDIWELVQAPETHVYLAGLGKVAEAFDRIMQEAAGDGMAWMAVKEGLRAQGRWSELIYS